VAPALSVDDTVAELPLPTELAAGETVPLSLAFTAVVPVDPSGGYGMYEVGAAAGTWSLAHWYPVLAGYGADGEWNLRPPSFNGDPIFTNTALYEVTLTAPAGLVLVTTGSEVAAEAAGEGQTRHRILTGPVRDFTIVADDDFQVVSQDVDGTTVNAWYNPGREEGAEKVLDYGAASLEMFNDLFGAYPYEEFDLVDVAVGGGAAGVEFPQLVFIGDDYYDNPRIEEALPGFFEFLVVHEVAHQWWYGLVGNDQYVDAFLDEGLTNYVSTVYFERRYGEAAGDYQVALNLELPYLADLFHGRGDRVVDQPTDDFPGMGDYGVAIYSKGALGFQAIREAIGDEAFFAALDAYADQFRFKVATPADLLAAFEVAAGQDLDELWRHWFEATEGTQDYTEADLAAVMDEVRSR
jgi:aminopeptidase N